jgi:hypothetical protein
MDHPNDRFDGSFGTPPVLIGTTVFTGAGEQSADPAARCLMVAGSTYTMGPGVLLSSCQQLGFLVTRVGWDILPTGKNGRCDCFHRQVAAAVEAYSIFASAWWSIAHRPALIFLHRTQRLHGATQQWMPQPAR